VIAASSFSSVHDFFHSSTWYVIRNLVVFFVVVFWIATIYWVYKDSRRRISDPLIVTLSVIVAIVPFIGPLVYMLFRPPEYIEDVRERELEIRAIERRLGGRDLRCPVCRADVEDDFLVCPVCTTQLRQACTGCERPLEGSWQICPYCKTPVPAGAVSITAAKRPMARRRRSG
jgi:RNA polymerase subunit RPABC4/transcription elongation factor Spt4